MDTEMVSAMFMVVSTQMLLAFRNDLVERLSRCSSAMRFRLYSDNDFQGALDTLDPELLCAAKDIEEALRAYELGIRFLS